MTRKVEEILKLVAESPYYTPDDTLTSSWFMCFALYYSNAAGLISEKEEKLASEAIKKYLNKLSKHSSSLRIALKNNMLPHTFEDRKVIYLDWKKRPKPWKD